MKFPLRFFLATILTFTKASTQENNTNVELPLYSPPTPWANFTQCQQAIADGRILASNPTFRPVFVDVQGHIIDGPANVSAGVGYKTCVNYCGTGSTQAGWSPFSQQFTAWLLPFIALTAQLPFQAVTTWDNLMSAALTVGSPALATYSLILTLFGNRWFQKQCEAAIDSIPVSTREDKSRRENLKKAIASMKEVLCLARQEPFENLQFAPLGNLEFEPRGNLEFEPRENSDNLQHEVDWWRKLEEIVRKSKRGYTASFVHQLLWVNIAFAFTVVDAFGSQNIGNDSTAYGLAVSLVWQWETPIVMGWVLVGTSAVETAVRTAVLELRDAIRIELRDTIHAFDHYDITIPRGQFIGDRAQPGPIFNYARAFIWAHRAEDLLNRYRDYRAPHTQPSPPHTQPSPPHTQPYPPHTQPYPPPSQWRSASIKHVIYSFFLALSLQWSVSGGSIILCYFTPTVGISCWSGGFLIYTVLSTVVLLLLMFSSFLSDHCIPPREGHTIRFCGPVAVILRTLGKTIAVLNSVWICVHCVFQFTSIYDNCWCNANAAILGQSGYWTWLSTDQLKDLPNISLTWSGSTCLAIIVPGLYIICLLVTRHHYGL